MLVSATSFRISPDSVETFLFSELATCWMRATESESAGKSLLCRIRRSRKSSVPLPAPPPDDAASSAAEAAGDSQSCKATRSSAAVCQRRSGSRSRPFRITARSTSSTSDDRFAGSFRSSVATRRIAWCGSRSVTSRSPLSSSASMTPTENRSIAAVGVPPCVASGDM